MKLSSLTTASLLSATLAFPAFAQEADAPVADERQAERVVIVQVDDENIEVDQSITLSVDGDAIVIEGADDLAGVDGADGGVTIRGQAIMLDEDGNVIRMDLEEGEWLIDDEDGEIMIELRELGLPHMMIEPGEDGDHRLFMPGIGARDALRSAPVNPPMVEATYLGVNCEPVDFDAAALLMINEGTGLDVGFVAEDSPASAAGIAVGDVLLTFNDQVLINPEQLAVLIRTQDEGDTVTLSVIREGEAFDVEAELGTNTVPQLGPGGQNLNQLWHVNPGVQGQDFQFAPMHLGWGHAAPNAEQLEQMIEMLQNREAVENLHLDLEDFLLHNQEMQEGMEEHRRALELLIQGMHDQQGDFNQDIRFQFQLNNQNGANAKLVWDDGEHTLTVTGDGEDGQMLNVVDAAGEVLFDGPMPEGDAINELPDSFRDKVIELQDVATNGIAEDE